MLVQSVLPHEALLHLLVTGHVLLVPGEGSPGGLSSVLWQLYLVTLATLAQHLLTPGTSIGVVEAGLVTLTLTSFTSTP